MSLLFAFQVFGSIVVLALLVVFAWLPARRRICAEGPLRAEINARIETDLHAAVVATLPVPGARLLPMRSRLTLTVRGNAFSLRNPDPVARLLACEDYCFRASETAIATVHGQRRIWIMIRRNPLGKGAVWISDKDRPAFIWDALIQAGAQPTSPPPYRSTTPPVVPRS